MCRHAPIAPGRSRQPLLSLLLVGRGEARTGVTTGLAGAVERCAVVVGAARVRVSIGVVSNAGLRRGRVARGEVRERFALHVVGAAIDGRGRKHVLAREQRQLAALAAIDRVAPRRDQEVLARIREPVRLVDEHARADATDLAVRVHEARVAERALGVVVSSVDASAARRSSIARLAPTPSCVNC